MRTSVRDPTSRTPKRFFSSQTLLLPNTSKRCFSVLRSKNLTLVFLMTPQKSVVAAGSIKTIAKGSPSSVKERGRRNCDFFAGSMAAEFAGYQWE